WSSHLPGRRERREGVVRPHRDLRQVVPRSRDSAQVLTKEAINSNDGYRRSVMRARSVLVIAALIAVTLGTAQNAWADNNATGSVGAVQTGPVGATPTATVSQAGATAGASVPVAIGGSGNNTATNSTG